MSSGEKHAWEQLQSLSPGDVCSRTGAAFDSESGTFSLELFGQVVDVATGSNEITARGPGAEHCLTAFAYFARLSVLGYLAGGQDVPAAGRLVNPAELPGVDAMVRGSHSLPLDKLAARYSADVEAFLKRGQTYSGVAQSYGDASLLLHPFKALPVVLILWGGDDEFPARSDLLLDAASRFQAPPDVLWCIMMLTVLAML